MINHQLWGCPIFPHPLPQEVHLADRRAHDVPPSLRVARVGCFEPGSSCHRWGFYGDFLWGFHGDFMVYGMFGVEWDFLWDISEDQLRDEV